MNCLPWDKLDDMEKPSGPLPVPIESLSSTDYENAPGWLVYECLFQHVFQGKVGGLGGVKSISQDRGGKSEYGSVWNDEERNTVFTPRKKNGIIGAMNRSNILDETKIRMVSLIMLSLSLS